jgi:hypothetical protein
MLKRSGAIVLTVLYLITVTGFALNLHYCGKLLTAVKIDAPAKGCNDPMSGKMKCCKDKQLVVKIKDAHQTEPASVLGKVFNLQLSRLPFIGIAFNTPAIIVSKAYDRGPPNPLLSDTPLFIKNCTFRI